MCKVRRLSMCGAVLAALGVMVTSAAAQEMQPPKIGEPAPGLQLKDLEGRTHTLQQYTDKNQVVVLHFQQINCPWDKNYQSYFNQLAEQYANKSGRGSRGSRDTAGVQFLAINSNKGETVSALKKTKQERPIAYPVLKDPNNKVADKYAAQVTPHMYVIGPEGNLQYRGGVETLPASPSKATKMDQQHLKPAIDAVLKGERVPDAVTKVKGCGIKRSN